MATDIEKKKGPVVLVDPAIAKPVSPYLAARLKVPACCHVRVVQRLRQKAAARLRDSVSLQNTVEHALEKRVETLFAGMSKSNKNEDDEKDDASLYGKLMKRTIWQLL